MNRALSAERWRIAGVVAAMLLLGLLSGNWFFAAVSSAAIYIGWNYYQFSRLSRWLKSGGTAEVSPEGGGIWQMVVSQIYKRESSIRRRKKRYKDVLKRLNSVISALPDAAIILNKNLEIEWSNEKAEELLGIYRQRDRGHLIGNLMRDPEFLVFLKSRKKDSSLEIKSPLDASRYIALRLTRFGKGQFLLTGQDVSERRILRRMRKAFFANASHELRTPLTVISGYLEILNSAEGVPQELKQPLANALQQTGRMGNILDDLLSLSRLEQSILPENEGETVDVGTMLQRVSADIGKTMADETHEIRLDLDPQLKLRGVSAEIESVVTNLIKNAVKYTSAGTEIDVTWSQNGKGYACLMVSDNGEGIPIKHLPHLTERFYRVDAGRSRAVGGTGLGLAIVKHIVERHGGFLNISSEEGEGTEVVACFSKSRVLKEAS